MPLRARISERLGHSGPTVSQTVGRMERDGLVVVSDDRTLELTDAGRQKAVDVMRKHRLAERLLSDVIGLDWAYVHEEACRWEHVMSEQVERRLIELLGHPTESPYGNPIPGLDQLGDALSGGFDQGVVGLVDSDEPRRRADHGHDSPARRARAGRPRAAAAVHERRRSARCAAAISATARATCSCRWTATTRRSNCRSRSRRTSSWSTTTGNIQAFARAANVTDSLPSGSVEESVGEKPAVGLRSDCLPGSSSARLSPHIVPRHRLLTSQAPRRRGAGGQAWLNRPIRPRSSPRVTRRAPKPAHAPAAPRPVDRRLSPRPLRLLARPRPAV